MEYVAYIFNCTSLEAFNMTIVIVVSNLLHMVKVNSLFSHVDLHIMYIYVSIY